MATDFSNTDLLDMDVHSVDPWPFYNWLLESEPLYYDKTQGLWAVSRYEDVVHVSKNPQLFCSGSGVIPNLPLDEWPDEAMINLDGDAHTCQRGLVSKGFTPRRVERLEGLVEKETANLIDAFKARGKVDLVKEFARPLPMRVIGHLLGYPVEKLGIVLDWTDTYTQGGSGPDHITEEVTDAFANFCEFHEELLEKRKAERGDDLLSVWLDAELDGEKLSEDKLLYEHNLLLVGGSETTRNAISGGMQELLRHPDQQKELTERLDDDEFMNNAVEEIVRWSCPFVRMKRTATQDVELHGKTIKEGDQVLMMYPAANRDPRVFDKPYDFDIRRDFARPSVAFGYGKHFCIGASLARLEIRHALRGLLTELPELRLSAEPAEKYRSTFIRGLKSLPLEFTPA